jgi:hydrogenase nickel incorporation protein HypA/HybF
MHELSVTQSIVDMIGERMEGAKVTGVRLEIGRLSGVLPDAVRFCFDIVCSGTVLEGAWLDIVEPRGRALCRTCETEFEPEGLILLCPCGGTDVSLVSGQQLRITAVEVV